jgi:NADH-quinone oxidoreductase subunit H
VAAVVLIVIQLVPERKGAEAAPAADAPFDAFADGFPVPPLPGQKLPPSARAERRARAAVGSGPAAISATEPAPDDTPPATGKEAHDE